MILTSSDADTDVGEILRRARAREEVNRHFGFGTFLPPGAPGGAHRERTIFHDPCVRAFGFTRGWVGVLGG